MKLSPLDIKKQEFKRGMRGFDPVEVETFLDMVSKEFEDLVKQNKDFKEKVIELDTQLKDYKQLEVTLRQTLSSAQETAEKSLENSRKEAQLIVQEAELKANQIVDHARRDLSKTKEELSTLKAKKEAIVSRLRVLLQSELELVRALEVDDESQVQHSMTKGTGKSAFDVDEIVRALDSGEPRKE